MAKFFHEMVLQAHHASAVAPDRTAPALARGVSCVGSQGVGAGAERGRSKPKVSRTRSHDPHLGYGALKQFVDKKASKPVRLS